MKQQIKIAGSKTSSDKKKIINQINLQDKLPKEQAWAPALHLPVHYF